MNLKATGASGGVVVSDGIAALEWVVFNIYKSKMGPKHNLGGRGCYYATFRTFGKWSWKSECRTAREERFHPA